MRHILVFGTLLLTSASAQASETITYTYDALGRLVQVTRSGTVNNGASALYTYDPANNRTNVTTAPGGGGMALTKPSEPTKEASQTGATSNAAPRQ
jgi:YD repeat-containing protein